MKTHPNPDTRHVMVCYRRYILGIKRKMGKSHRSVCNYLPCLKEYLACKRELLGAQ